MTADQQETVKGSKTMFDPCPPGYRVPTYAEVKSMADIGGETAGTCCAIVDGKLYFPYTSSRGAGITPKWWGGVAEDATDTSIGERGFYHCDLPYNTGNKSTRNVYRFYARKGGVGYSGSYCSRATGMVVRCIKG